MKKSEEFFLKNKPRFLFGMVNINQLDLSKNIEVAFVGKSNVGKSSLINAITNSKISISSKTPGRTKEINFFNVNDKINFVDMPGYGFAKVKKETKDNWIQLIYDYFYYSKNLKKVFILISAKKGIDKEDFDIIELLDKMNINYKIILTKSDSCNKIELENIKNNLKDHDFILTSSKDKYGINELRDEIYYLINS